MASQSSKELSTELLAVKSWKVLFACIDNITICSHNNYSNHNHNLKRFMAVVNKYNLILNNDKSSFCMDGINLLGYTVSKGSMTLDPKWLKPYWNCQFWLTCLPSEEIWACLAITLSGLCLSQKRYAHWYKWIVFPGHPWQFWDCCHGPCFSFGGPLVLETDECYCAIAAWLKQSGCPVVVFFKDLILIWTVTFSSREGGICHSRGIEKMKALPNWAPFQTHYQPKVCRIHV